MFLLANLRSGKVETFTDELQTADKKVEHLRNALQLVSKRLTTGAGSTQGQDPAAREKRLKKLPEYMLGLAMLEASNYDDDESILKYILHECGEFWDIILFIENLELSANQTNSVVVIIQINLLHF